VNLDDRNLADTPPPASPNLLQEEGSNDVSRYGQYARITSDLLWQAKESFTMPACRSSTSAVVYNRPGYQNDLRTLRSWRLRMHIPPRITIRPQTKLVKHQFVAAIHPAGILGHGQPLCFLSHHEATNENCSGLESQVRNKASRYKRSPSTVQ
jgi:hypothetical protein